MNAKKPLLTLEEKAAQNKTPARKKACAVIQKLRDMKLKEAAKEAEGSAEEMLTYMDFPYAHWLKIRPNNVTERLRRQLSSDAGLCPAVPCLRHKLGCQTIYEHGTF